MSKLSYYKNIRYRTRKDIAAGYRDLQENAHHLRGLELKKQLKTNMFGFAVDAISLLFVFSFFLSEMYIHIYIYIYMYLYLFILIYIYIYMYMYVFVR